ncbi:QacE family quaternary ammonium compound efflux SMR transporter [Rothia kristinae]|uniref:QacE family quaternary ammonium compound efflux SMR transporter n=1 Tax=Rothia kristinae TaxID=37923 RepID=A0A7T4MTX4_9MICC|nr:SMR family transporter [Rothia kristinae]QQC59517.1 QacE family quaternary ammonium compound efflux SMR transporter [Rothia kristinae]
MKRALLLVAAILAEVSASLSLKAAMTAPWLYTWTVTGYTLAFVLLGLLLRAGMALGVAYGLWGAGGVALTALASAAIFGEALTARMGLGLVLVIAGVLCVELGSQRVHRRALRPAELGSADIGLAGDPRDGRVS